VRRRGWRRARTSVACYAAERRTRRRTRTRRTRRRRVAAG